MGIHYFVSTGTAPEGITLERDLLAVAGEVSGTSFPRFSTKRHRPAAANGRQRQRLERPVGFDCPWDLWEPGASGKRFKIIAGIVRH